jgi:dienelactone hydrolase
MGIFRNSAVHVPGRPFTCVRDGLTIVGTAFLPEKEEKTPAVIISHGFMATQTTVKMYAEKMAAAGIAAFIFDYNGGGVGSKSSGKSTEMSVLTEIKDLKAVIEYASGLETVDVSRLFLMGCSQGGFVSGMTAAQLKEQIRGLIMFYPALCIPDDARKGHMMFSEFDPQNIPDTFRCGPMKLGKCYAEAAQQLDFAEELKGYGGPVLIIHGDADPIVNVSYSERARDAYSEGQCRLTVLPGAGHGFKGTDDRIAIQEAVEFLQEKSGTSSM